MENTVLIYGGTGGIGLATAQALRNRGYALHLVSRSRDRLRATAAELGARFTVGDVCDDELFSRVAEEVDDRLCGLVYAVGTLNLRGFARLSEREFLHDFKVNAVGAALAVQAVLPALREGPGTSSVVLFSSVAALQGFALHSSMSMAKAAVNGLTLALAAELAPQVRVNAIAPSLTRTPLSEAVIPNDQIATAVARLHALPRLGTPADMAALATFLLSPQADWITGQIIAVDGGRSTLRTKG